jgi:hypothetical protein
MASGVSILLLVAVAAGLGLLPLVPTLFLVVVLALPALLPFLLVALVVTAGSEVSELTGPLTCTPPVDCR